MTANTNSLSSSLLTYPSNDLLETEAPYLTLEVCRGQTKFRHRPICEPRFLIGTGTGCDLRLGGEGIPPLHSIITFQDGEVQIEAIADHPPLSINGKIVENAVLRDGDVLEVGNFCFGAHVEPQTETVVADWSPEEIAELHLEEGDQPAVTELSAADIIDRLEADLQIVEGADHKVETGVRAMLHAAIAARQPHRNLDGVHELRGPHFHSRSPADIEFMETLERVSRQLDNFAVELEQRARNVSRREERYDVAARELSEAQSRLATQLESALEEIEHRENAVPTRAIA